MCYATLHAMQQEPPTTTKAARDIGRMIRDARRDPDGVFRGGLTQDLCARLLDVEPSLLSKWERGVVVPSLPNLRNLSRSLDLDFDRLVELAMRATEQRREGAA